MRIILSLATLLGLLFSYGPDVVAQEVNGRVTIEQYIGEHAEESSIMLLVDRWEQAVGDYYRTLYDSGVSVRLSQEARDLVERTYQEARFFRDEIAVRDPKVVLAVIFVDLEFMLNMSFFNSVHRLHGSFDGFVRGLRERAIEEILIDPNDVREAIVMAGCGRIPCNRERCDPDTCAPRRFDQADQ